MGGRNRGGAARAYGSCTHPHPWANEQGLRVLLGNAVLAGAQRGLRVTPVFSLYSPHGPVFRCLVRIERGVGGGVERAADGEAEAEGEAPQPQQRSRSRQAAAARAAAAMVDGVGFTAFCPVCGGGFAVAWGANFRPLSSALLNRTPPSPRPAFVCLHCSCETQ